MVTPSNPCCAAACMTSVGNSPDLSILAARCNTISRANCSISDWKAFWSAVSSKSIGRRSTQKPQNSQQQSYSAYSARSASNVVFLQAFEDWPQLRRRRRQIFRQDPHIADNGHEIRVAVPPRHQMYVQVIDDAGAGRPAQIDADVDALRFVRLGQRHLGMPGQSHQLRLFVGGRRLQTRNVPL